jgi:very-short-patch-repair endonuclease
VGGRKMLSTKTIKVKWHINNGGWLFVKGYSSTSFNDYIEVNVHDLPKGSNYEIELLCDYCLEEGTETVITRTYKDYMKGKGRSAIDKDCCKFHRTQKLKEINTLLNFVKIDKKIKETIKKTKKVNERAKTLHRMEKAIETAQEKGLKITKWNEEYKNRNSIFTVQCIKNPSHVYETSYNLIRNNGCRHCKRSKGELKIEKYLRKNKIQFEVEYTFEDCKNIKPLPFDFAIFDQDNLKCLIEFDGEQHFKPLKYSKDVDKNRSKFKMLQKRDRIKNDYCGRNEIPLIRIKYTDLENIENILNQKLEISC